MNSVVIASLCYCYHLLAIEHYQKYCEATKLYNMVSDNNKSFDILSHSDDEASSYFLSFKERQKNGIISVVFEAMAVESLINYYIVKNYGDEVFSKQYKDKSIWGKYKTIIKKITGKRFDEYSEEYQLFSQLINIRNNLVHSKSQMIDMYNEDSQEFFDKMSELSGGIENNIFISIDKVINTYDMLIKILK